MKTNRQAMLAKIHIARKDLGLSEDDYRHVLTVNFGVESSAQLPDRELDALLKHFRRCGWNQKPSAAPKRRRDFKPPVSGDKRALVDKIEAQLAELARYKGKRVPWSYAENILRRQTSNPKAFINWASPEELEKVIQSLYYQLKRETAKP